MSRSIIKKIISVMLCLPMLFALPAGAYAAEAELTVTKDYQIFFDNNELSASAEYLNRFIKDICGYSLTIADSKASAGKYIILSVDPTLESGYNVSADGKNITISGGSLRGVVDGICGFLTKYGGIRFYTSDTVVKTKSNITIPASENYSYTPYFEMTETDWYSPCDLDYSLFNGISGTSYRKFPAELGGGAEYISSFAHTMTNQFCSKDKYFEDHRDCFALCAGFRTKESLCLSNPETLEIVTAEVLDLLKEKHDPDADLQIVSLTQNDNILFCTCPRCLARYAKYGSISGLTIEFANSVAREVKAAGYDNVAIDTFAYMYTRSAPKRIVPDDNIIVRLCSIECCFSHPLNDRFCTANVGFATDLKNWSEICSRLYVWDYTTNYCNYIGIFPNFDVLQENMQFFYENNVKGVYEEGNYSMTECDTEFGELRSYLICKLMQDPYCDIKAERAAFLNAYYGDGGRYIDEFIDIISDSAASAHMSIYSSMKDTCSLSRKEIVHCDELWKSAESSASGEALRHVTDSELAWRYWKYKNNASEYKNIVTRKDTKAQYDEDIAAAPINAYRECSETKAFFLAILQVVRYFLGDVVHPFIYLINMMK